LNNWRHGTCLDRDYHELINEAGQHTGLQDQQKARVHRSKKCTSEYF
jgi:hypothetical protein